MYRAAALPRPSRPTPRLTLGFLLRAMRAGQAGGEGERVTLEFHQRGAEGAVGSGPAATVAVDLHALVDHAGADLERAEVSLDGSAAGRSLRFRRTGAEGYAYSVDGGRGWGRFLGRPRVFELGEFTAALEEVAVEDVNFEAVPADRWSAGAARPSSGNSAPAVASLPAQALDVTLSRAAFTRLLRIFAADLDEDDALALSGFSVSIAAAEDVSLVCWWSLRGLAAPAETAPGPAEPRASHTTCSVAVHVAPIPRPPAEEVVVDPALPLLGRVDEVWGLLRRS